MNNSSASLPAGHRPRRWRLLVDRDAGTRRMYAEYLKRSSCAIEEADDGREALAKAIARPPGIIVTETRLPGHQRLRPVRAPAPATPRRGQSRSSSSPAMDSKTTSNRASIVGADSVLVNPCLPETLLNEISRLLDQSVRACVSAGGRRAKGCTTRSSARIA